MIKVYRIENDEGLGPFYKNLWDEDFNPQEFQSFFRHPSPNNDDLLQDWWKGLGLDKDHWKFAFQSIEQLKEWFWEDSHFRSFHKNGFKLAVYLICPDSVKFGKKQVVFDDSDCRNSKTIYNISEVVDPSILV